eukprot:6210767-Pleurochrysis_carterae.AAC.2
MQKSTKSSIDTSSYTRAVQPVTAAPTHVHACSGAGMRNAHTTRSKRVHRFERLCFKTHSEECGCDTYGKQDYAAPRRSVYVSAMHARASRLEFRALSCAT